MKHTVVRLALVTLVATLLAGVPATSASAGTATTATTAERGSRVITRTVEFQVVNTNATRVACEADQQAYRVRARIVGPRREVLSPDAPRINVLVHGLATGSWFWNLRSKRSFDYATQLARRGETSVVIDRLGYGASTLPNGDDTCLGAQADMLHQIVQKLYSGLYVYPGRPGIDPPKAQHVVLHGHGVGAAIAQVESATFQDVDGLVLMSWADAGSSQRAVEEARQTSQLCATGDDYARYGQTNREFRELLFATAPAGVQRKAARLHAANPCGDALSLSQMLAGSEALADEIKEPVLLMYGGKDVLIRDGAAQDQADSYSAAESVTLRTIAGAGSALPLERTAGKTQRQVVRWLRSTFN
ncbi:alpha/beta fold hydrolase [Nocardioides sp.]|uniref:alpha/beta fold hydrolase n=1 Tax=Nocardioides sp. TaxID=35761 RepID=UPI0035657189